MMLPDPSRLLMPFMRCWFCWPSVTRRAAALCVGRQYECETPRARFVRSVGHLLLGVAALSVTHREERPSNLDSEGVRIIRVIIDPRQ
jgi:hypothetical protein